MKTKLLNFIGIIFLCITSISCTNDDDEVIVLEEPTIANIEVGLNNNEIGVIGRDFHFNAEILAGDKIDAISLKIQPKVSETYAFDWSLEVVWEEYKGVKNATVHKHFDISESAAEGIYDLIITVEDENGTKLEEVKTITIFLPESLPVDPKLEEFSVSARGDSGFRILYILSRGGYRDSETLEYGDYNVFINENETLNPAATISGIKGDGKLYILLINKKHNHRPESINSIDFTKAIVVDVFEHNDLEQTDRWTHVNYLRPEFPDISKLLIGASVDNNYPNPIEINSLKAWESGDYYVGVIYENTTYRMSLFHYLEVSINMD